jgi:hypothetical protein
MKIFASHAEHNNLVQQIVNLAQHKNLLVCHNVTSARYGHFDGWHRYVLLDNDATDFSIRSKSLLTYFEARYIRYGKPSKIAEQRCLRSLLSYLQMS